MEQHGSKCAILLFPLEFLLTSNKCYQKTQTHKCCFSRVFFSTFVSVCFPFFSVLISPSWYCGLVVSLSIVFKISAIKFLVRVSKSIHPSSKNLFSSHISCRRLLQNSHKGTVCLHIDSQLLVNFKNNKTFARERLLNDWIIRIRLKDKKIKG